MIREEFIKVKGCKWIGVEGVCSMCGYKGKVSLVSTRRVFDGKGNSFDKHKRLCGFCFKDKMIRDGYARQIMM